VRKRILWLCMVAAGLPSAAGAQDATRGQKAFAQRCAACHVVAADKRSALGPNLFALVGRKAGSAPSFRYSPALTASKTTWTAKSLDAFLAAPGKFLPGTRMLTAVPDAATRADIIAFLATRK
jgi:cytochrome c